MPTTVSRRAKVLREQTAGTLSSASALWIRVTGDHFRCAVRLLGDAEIAIAGGADSMSRAPYSMPSARFGNRMGNARLIDMMVGALTDPFDDTHMGMLHKNTVFRGRCRTRSLWIPIVAQRMRSPKAISKSKFCQFLLKRKEELPSLIAMNTRRGRSSLYGCWAGPCGPKKHWNVRDSRSIK
jgi:hypothetical protein